MSWLLDADVVSQPVKKHGDPRVIAWMRAERDQCYTSTIVIAQLAYWVRTKEGTQREALQQWLNRFIEGFGGRIRSFNPNSEVEPVSRAAVWGAHAAGVQFSAARRKPRSTHLFVRGGKLELGHAGLGGPPKPARGPRALPIPISEFGFNLSVAHVWAEQKHLLAQSGTPMPVEDSYIAATARRHGLTIVTGNDRDFRRPGVKVFNPFKEAPPA